MRADGTALTGSSLIPHPFRFYPLLAAEGFVGLRSDLTGFDLASSAPEDVGVADRNADFGKVLVHGGFMGKDDFLFLPVGDSHDVDVVELGAEILYEGRGEEITRAFAYLKPKGRRSKRGLSLFLKGTVPF